MELPWYDVLGHWIAIFVTISTFSYLYDDNPFYKLIEHVFVGVSIGYVVVIQYFDVIEPNLIDRLVDPALGTARFIYLVPLLLVFLLFTKLSRRFSWLGRIAIAFVIGIYAGQEVPALANADLVEQVGATLSKVGAYSSQIHGAPEGVTAAMLATWPDALGLLVLVLGMVAGLVYFFFSIEHRGAIGVVAKVGVWTLMVGFGAAFGYTVQGRISLAIGRAMYCMGMTQNSDVAAQLHSRTVSLVCLVFVFGTIVWLQRREASKGESPE